MAAQSLWSVSYLLPNSYGMESLVRGVLEGFLQINPPRGSRRMGIKAYEGAESEFDTS